MKTVRILTLVIFASLLVSCVVSKTDPDYLNNISISASVKKMDIVAKSHTKAASSANPFEVISSNHILEAKLLFSFDEDSYLQGTDNNIAEFPLFGQCHIPCHTSAVFASSDFEFIKYEGDNLTYPSGDTDHDVFCVGLYPKDKWSISADGETAGKTAYHPIDGSSDIMFADIIKGSWSSPFSKPLNFKHLQTWIKVLVSANTNDAAEKWGNVTKITVGSASGVNIALGSIPAATSATTCTSNVTYAADTVNITVFENDGGMPLSITTQEIGSVFVVSPARNSNNDQAVKFYMKVHTETFPEGKDVKVLLYDLNNQLIQAKNETIGKLFVLNLNFTNLDVIEGVCTLNYWNDQDDDLYLQ